MVFNISTGACALLYVKNISGLCINTYRSYTILLIYILHVSVLTKPTSGYMYKDILSNGQFYCVSKISLRVHHHQVNEDNYVINRKSLNSIFKIRRERKLSYRISR
jgi:hypothetical protein